MGDGRAVTKDAALRAESKNEASMLPERKEGRVELDVNRDSHPLV